MPLMKARSPGTGGFTVRDKHYLPDREGQVNVPDDCVAYATGCGYDVVKPTAPPAPKPAPTPKEE